MKPISRKISGAFEVKIEGDGRTIIGKAASYNGAPDSYGDIILPGAFKGCLERRRRVKMMYNHGEVLGMAELSDRDDGLYFVGRVSDTMKGSDVLTLIKDGVIDKCSFGYRTLEAYMEKGVRYLKALDLFEVSVVDFPANESTAILGVKSDMPTPEQLQMIGLAAYNLISLCKEYSGESEETDETGEDMAPEPDMKMASEAIDTLTQILKGE